MLLDPGTVIPAETIAGKGTISIKSGSIRMRMMTDECGKMQSLSVSF
jgi:hypothetical protein